MDDIDLASKLIEKTIQKALNDNKAVMEDSGISDCISCEIPIPLARKKASPSSIRCIDCQEIEDIKNG